MIRLYLLSAALEVFGATLYPYTQILLRNLGFSQSLVGVIIALTQLSACMVPLFVCNYADKSGKTKIIYLICIATALISHYIFIKWSSLLIVIIFATLVYACTSNMAVFNDVIIDLTISNRKLKGNYSTYRSVGTISYVITLILFTVFQFPKTSNNSQILLGLTVSSCILFFAVFIIPNPVTSVPAKENKTAFFDIKWFPKEFYDLILIIFIKSIANAVIEKLLGSYMTEVLNLGSSFTIFVALGALTEFFFMIILGKKLKQGKITEFSLIKLSCLGMLLRLGLYATSTNLIVFTIAQLFHCLTFAASHIAIVSYISKNVERNHIGLAVAIYQSIAMNLAQFVGSFGGGFIIDYLGYPALFKIYMIFPAIALILCYNKKSRLNIA